MYLPGDLMASKARQNDLLGVVKIRTRTHVLSGSRPPTDERRVLSPRAARVA